MSEDQLSQDRIQPTPAVGADAPGAPGADKHRSVADGELATAWTLDEYFGALNNVMRLPSRARRRLEGAAAAGGSTGGPALGPALTRLVLFGGGLVVIAVLVVRPLILWATDAGHASLKSVAGVWEAGKGKHEGRLFEVSDSAVVFHTGEHATDYTWHRVQEVRVKEAGDSALYTVIYEEGKRNAELAFWYYGRPAPSIRLKNQPEVLWTPTRQTPVTGPPPSNRPRL